MLRKITLILIFISCFFYSGTGLSQSVYNFKMGYMLPIDLNYGREALVVDTLAYQLFNNAFTYPSAGNLVFSLGGKEIAWQPIEADTSGNFRGELLASGYLCLQYESEEEKTALLNLSGHSMAFFNGVPHGGDIYKYGWLFSPVKVRKGENYILIRCSRWARWQGITARLVFPQQPVMLNSRDVTLPHVVLGQKNDDLLGGIVIINSSEKELKNLALKSRMEGKERNVPVPVIPAMASRKVAFRFDGGNLTAKGTYPCQLLLMEGANVVDQLDLNIDVVKPGEHYSNTFISNIDGSVQYYSVTPQQKKDNRPPALFLSVHGAEVEAIGQARAYDPKDWGILVAPTNRRPRGFNWEEWGMLDALEVLQIAKKKFHPDPTKIYLTGHSMGGHGTWYLGATFPGQWAAIGPCAGYPTLTAYGSSDGKIPAKSLWETERILLQASNPSNVLELVKNYNAAGIYIHHGDSDKVVSVEYARQMRRRLGEFHKDFSYYEYPGGSHWFGDESVDWPPMFEYFKWHAIPADSAVNVVDFTTANPAISSQYFWVEVLQQQQSFKFSHIELRRSNSARTITGTTENIAALAFDLSNFSVGDTVKITLDNTELSYVTGSPEDTIYLIRKENWSQGNKPPAYEKGTERGGGFKEAFNHRMVFVYGTGGNEAEKRWAYEKAVYDAEVWYYRGNGAVDLVADKDFDPARYPDRGVVLYGNSNTNKAWKKLLAACPVQVQEGSIAVGDKKFSGEDLGAYFMWPRPDSEVASIAVISGTGIKGMKATESNQYFAAGSGFPDFMIFSLDMLKTGAQGIRCAGFYTNDWQIDLSNSAFYRNSAQP